MNSPVRPLLQALAERILANLDKIEAVAAASEEPNPDRPVYSDTQLLISLLGVLVFPHERAPDALGELLKGYNDLSDVVNIRYRRGNYIEDPCSIKSLPRLLRNSIAHFNVLPLKENGRFSGVRVWNKDEAGNVTLVADLAFDVLRNLARHILGELAQLKHDKNLHDPEDPLDESGKLKIEFMENELKKPPGISNSVWTPFFIACNGDMDWAKEEMDKALKERTKLIERVRNRTAKTHHDRKERPCC